MCYRSSLLRMVVSTTSMLPLNRIHGRNLRHSLTRKVCIFILEIFRHKYIKSNIVAHDASVSAPNPAHLIAQQALAAVTGMGGPTPTPVRREKNRMEWDIEERQMIYLQFVNSPMEKKDKSRPVSSNPVAGTPWCVVWTGDSKVSILVTFAAIIIYCT